MWEVIEKRNIITLWFLWHYHDALQDIILKWKNILRFNLNYFSISFLLKTFFSPWRRYKLSRGRGFDFGKFAEVLVFNTFSRFMGMIMRTVVIISGVLLQIIIVALGFLVLVFWIFFPLLIFLGIIMSLKWLILN